MALEFTGRPDRAGPALYLIDRGMHEDARLIALGTEVDNATDDNTQVVYLREHSHEAQAVIGFYAVPQLPATLIVMDDDQLNNGWYHHLPSSSELVYAMSRAGARVRGDQ